MADEARLGRLEEEVAALKLTTSHGFGKVDASLEHLQALVSATIDRPPPPPPVWVMLLTSATLVVAVATLLLAVAQMVR